MNKKTNDFEWLWQHNQGALFLKEENSSLLWKKSLAEYFYRAGQHHEIIKLEIAIHALEAIANEVEIDTNTYRQYIDMIVGNRIKAKEALKEIKKNETNLYIRTTIKTGN